MRRTPLRLLAATGLLALGAAACGGSTGSAGTASGASPSTSAAASTGDYAAIEAAAKGQTVNWYMYGAIDNLNGFVNGYVADQLKAKGITLNQVKINDTAEAVNKVLAEKQAGKDTGGSVDLIWINGENFATLKQANLLHCGYVDSLPSASFVDLTSPALANDFGLPVEGCETPWQQATSGVVYNSEKVTPADVSSLSNLFAWSEQNPGRFTYPAPPDFTGSMVVRTAFYDTAGGPEQFLGDFDETKYDAAAAQTWERLNTLEPSLYRAGKTYPQGGSDVVKLFADGEIDAYLTYDTGATGAKVTDGSFPASTRTAVFDGGNIGNYSYVAIPYNAAHTAAATVLANILLSPEAQIENYGPKGAGFYPAIDVTKLDATQKAAYEAVPVPASQLPPATLAASTLPEVGGAYVTRLEKDWTANVLQK